MVPFTANQGMSQTGQEAVIGQKLLKPELVKYNEVSKTIDLESHMEI